MQRKITIVWYRGLYIEIHIDISIILAIEMVIGIDLDKKKNVHLGPGRWPSDLKHLLASIPRMDMVERKIFQTHAVILM